jgi:sialic acid synthase SpsE
MNTQDIFSQRNAKTTHPLFIFEMANNHMGNVEHGLKIIRAFGEVIKKFPQFTFAFKFQYRDLDTFIHPDYQGRMDLKYVKRFSETKLSEAEFLTLKNEATQLGFITICTPFDEVSVDRVVAHGYDILKIASASSTDWPLLEKIVTTDKPLIASTGGTKLEDVDRLVSFFKHRQKTFAIMHCVGEYPTLASNLEMNQIDLFKDRFEDIVIGFSTHEEPGNTEPVKLAVYLW